MRVSHRWIVDCKREGLMIANAMTGTYVDMDYSEWDRIVRYVNSRRASLPEGYYLTEPDKEMDHGNED